MTHAHVSGQHDGGCQACIDDTTWGPEPLVCHDAQPADDTDPERRGLCGWCGHEVEEVTPPLIA